jgi:trehalose 6-phosphate phosphatase
MTRATFSDAVDIAAYRAAVFDLDGMVTRTAELHALAWKTMFDAFLAERASREGSPFVPFDLQVDYLTYVDGKPRAQGVESFLVSRGIVLEPGLPADPPGCETHCGLGTRKNDLFLRLLDQKGIALYESTLVLIRRLRAAGLRTALVTSSENGAKMLEQAGIAELFDARVDGSDALRLGLLGKPHPDVFDAALQALSIPASQAIAVEDALSGVASAAAAGYALVIGIDRSGQLGAQMRGQGANIVVPDLQELKLFEPLPAAHLPDALESLDVVLGNSMSQHTPCLFLDYDGTLTDIADRPEQAVLQPSVRALLGELSAWIPVAIVSGRDRESLERLVGLPQLAYAGSHGFDIRGPDGLWQHPDAVTACAVLDKAQRQLQQAIGEIPGVLVERKRFAIAVHYRLVSAEEVDRVRMAAANTVRHSATSLRLTCGKCVVELRPSLEWSKGDAVRWLCERLAADVIPLYLGDDETDEDAFRVMPSLGGWGIRVGDGKVGTYASHRLATPAAVEKFLESLLERFGRIPAGGRASAC